MAWEEKEIRSFEHLTQELFFKIRKVFEREEDNVIFFEVKMIHGDYYLTLRSYPYFEKGELRTEETIEKGADRERMPREWPDILINRSNIALAKTILMENVQRWSKKRQKPQLFDPDNL